MKYKLLALALFSFLLGSSVALAQTEEEILDQLLQDENNSIEALVLYPEDTRIAILEVAKFPEALIKMESMQAKTSEAFKALMESYPREVQEQVWDLTRYPRLIEQLAAIGPDAGQRLQDVLADFPAEIHQRARWVIENHYPLLTAIDRLNWESESAFENLVSAYPPVTSDALRQLTTLPEVLSILTSDIKQTILVGDLYRTNPKWLIAKMDSLNLVVARERTRETEAWKQSLEDNPAAKEEMATAARDFANEYGYSDDYYAYDDDLYEYEDEEDDVIAVHHYYYQYPYWFGYPYWYMYPRWRPYPYWYDWGFYWGTGHSIVIIDLPSFYFTNWYFYYPHHHHYFPHLSSHFVNHYYGHRTSSSSVTVGVRTWRNRNREVVTDNWINEARHRPQYFKDYGKFETSRTKYNRSHPDKPLTQREYAEKNKKRYPVIATEAKQERPRTRVETVPPKQKRTDPVITPPKSREPATVPKTKRKTEPAKPPVNIPKVDRAREHHQGTIEKSKKQTSRNRTITQPKTRRPKTTVKPKTKTTVKPKTKTTKPTVKKRKGGGE